RFVVQPRLHVFESFYQPVELDSVVLCQLLFGFGKSANPCVAGMASVDLVAHAGHTSRPIERVNSKFGSNHIFLQRSIRSGVLAPAGALRLEDSVLDTPHSNLVRARPRIDGVALVPFLGSWSQNNQPVDMGFEQTMQPLGLRPFLHTHVSSPWNRKNVI